MSLWGVDKTPKERGDVQQGKISAVIVKDMSRARHDYLQVDFYTVVMFREKCVHFITSSNGADSAKRENAEFAPFLHRISLCGGNQLQQEEP